MARLRKTRKLGEQGVATTLYLRLGVRREAQREAEREGASLSVFVNTLIQKEIDRRKAAQSAA